MKDENQLVVVQKENALQLFTTEKGLDPILLGVRKFIDEFKPDITSKKGRDAIASIAHSVAKSKTYLDGIGKELVDKLKEQPKLVDAERKRIRDTLDAWKDEVRKPLTEWEEKEERRVQYHKSMIQHIKDCANGLIGGQAQPFAILFRELEEKVIVDEKWEEFEAEAHREKEAALKSLKMAFEQHQIREKEQAELERLRKETAEREQKEREERLMREAADNARREAEMKAQREREEVARVEREKQIESERREMQLKLQAEAAERQRLEAEQRAEWERQQSEARAKQAAENERLRIEQQQAAERAEAEKQAANKAHRASVNREILSALVGAGFTEEQGKLVVRLAASKLCGQLVINY